MKESYAIDIVVPWVDDSDPLWRAKKAAYTGVDAAAGNTDVRYRDWDMLRYWFRGVERFAPWVRYVWFVTDDQKPAWLNVEHPKLKWVKHTDFIPAAYLPTFSSHTIEWNLHRIDGLAEHFIYFNDDVFLIRDTLPTDFFVDGLPCDLPNVGPLYPDGFFSYLLFNNVNLLNRHFSLRDSIRRHPTKWIKGQSLGGLFKLALYGRKSLIPNSNNHHIQVSLLRSTFATLWEQEGELIDATCRNKTRQITDVTAYTVRDWQLFSGGFSPKKPIGKLFHTASMSHSNEALEYVRKQKGKTVCLNDTEDETDFEAHKQALIAAFDTILPAKSSFEL